MNCEQKEQDLSPTLRLFKSFFQLSSKADSLYLRSTVQSCPRVCRLSLLRVTWWHVSTAQFDCFPCGIMGIVVYTSLHDARDCGLIIVQQRLGERKCSELIPGALVSTGSGSAGAGEPCRLCGSVNVCACGCGHLCTPWSTSLAGHLFPGGQCPSASEWGSQG